MTGQQRQPRLLDPGYLAWLRQQNCICGCNEAPPCDAAHLRAGSLKYNKPMTGMGRKPDDKWALPLKHSHHMRQHAHGDELGWWSAHGVGDPFRLCQRYYAAYGGSGGVERKRRMVKPRRPKEQRTPIKSRGFAKGPKRKMQSRGFSHGRK